MVPKLNNCRWVRKAPVNYWTYTIFYPRGIEMVNRVGDDVFFLYCSVNEISNFFTYGKIESFTYQKKARKNEKIPDRAEYEDFTILGCLQLRFYFLYLSSHPLFYPFLLTLTRTRSKIGQIWQKQAILKEKELLWKDLILALFILIYVHLK